MPPSLLLAAVGSLAPVLGIGLLAGLVGLVCAVIVLADAFRKSVGTGVMTLLIPCFVLYYGFVHFEHRRKGWLLAGFIGGWGLSAILGILVHPMAA